MPDPSPGARIVQFDTANNPNRVLQVQVWQMEDEIIKLKQIIDDLTAENAALKGESPKEEGEDHGHQHI